MVLIYLRIVLEKVPKSKLKTMVGICKWIAQIMKCWFSYHNNIISSIR